jgi:hypothetical protein
MSVYNDSSFVRINITVPKRLVAELEKETPERGKSGFISQAIEEKLVRERREKALKVLRTLPPAFPEIKDAASYIRKIREEEDKKRPV